MAFVAEGFAGCTGLVFSKPDGSQLMQRDILKHSLHPILKKLGLEQGGPNIFRRFRITRLETAEVPAALQQDRKSTRLNSSHVEISYAVFCLKKKKKKKHVKIKRLIDDRIV